MQKSNDPLHGVKLATIIDELVDFYGWEYMGNTVNIRCFTHRPTVKSSLHFLRRTPWARTKVEQMYLQFLQEKEKQ
ncbi:VF530 family protein [Cellulophaga omnivescoria]|uniref:VF530 family protein n=1 Tax=Cellulophaga omnivescoria TaxID=1888890 RepID=UPI0022F07983|nr:VF530 family protein [Cellulophaga omnivescoria]WBU89478.1 VF530 family protein [Cellulophaga omnivescoria]WKB81501.1 VF530 family protein [Cellulophaga lytica]